MAEDADGPWKEILDIYLEPALQLLYPDLFARIAWDRGYESLEQELLRITPSGQTDLAAVDKLIKVWTHGGRPSILLIHLEVQAQRRKSFAQRMFRYHIRIFDAYGMHPRSLAILADSSRTWRPEQYQFRRGNTRGRFHFESIKLLDFASRQQELAESSNPFAVLIEAHLRAMQTRREPERRRIEKLALVKSLRTRGLALEEVRRLFRFLDWMMQLPPEVNRPWWQDVQTFDQEQTMPFIDIMTQEATEKGLAKGLKQGLEQGLQQGVQQGLQQGLRLAHQSILRIITARFGEQPDLRQRIEMIQDEKILIELNLLAATAPTIADVLSGLESLSAG